MGFTCRLSRGLRSRREIQAQGMEMLRPKLIFLARVLSSLKKHLNLVNKAECRRRDRPPALMRAPGGQGPALCSVTAGLVPGAPGALRTRLWNGGSF